MKRYVNAVLDLAGLLLFGALLSTGLMMKYILPPGSGRGQSASTVLGLGRHDWGGIHFWVSLAFIVMVIVHVWLHWRWVWGVMAGSAGTVRRVAGIGAGLGGAAAVIVMAVLPFVLPVEPGKETQGQGRGRVGAHEETSAATPAAAVEHEARDSQSGENRQIRGSTTLAEAAAMAGVGPGELARELGTTEPVTGQERLGELREKHGWSMRDIRDAVQSLSNPK